MSLEDSAREQKQLHAELVRWRGLAGPPAPQICAFTRRRKSLERVRKVLTDHPSDQELSLRGKSS